jgi:hypothetical protein
MEIETTILGGLPVTIAFSIESADPSVGIYHKYAADWHITSVKNKPVRKGGYSAEWLRKDIASSAAEAPMVDLKLSAAPQLHVCLAPFPPAATAILHGAAWARRLSKPSLSDGGLHGSTQIEP